MAETKDIAPGTYMLELGKSFVGQRRSDDPSYHTLRYDFKPMSVASSDSDTYIAFGTNGDVHVAVPTDGDNMSVFKGSKKEAKTKECLLFFDKKTGKVRLEKIASNISVKKTRDLDPSTENILRSEMARLRASRIDRPPPPEPSSSSFPGADSSSSSDSSTDDSDSDSGSGSDDEAQRRSRDSNSSMADSDIEISHSFEFKSPNILGMSSPSVKVEMDRLPLPVHISFIRSKIVEGETLCIGNKSFSKVMCIGSILSCRHVPSLSSLEYVVFDPSADAAAPKEISVIHREEVKSANSTGCQRFLVGTLIFITGKLIRFKGAIAIQAYSLREFQLICSEEYECLKMEAFLAVQYHTKNPSGQTPVRQPRPSSEFRKSFPLFTPSAPGKRIGSSNTVHTISPKRSAFPSAKSSDSFQPIGSKGDRSDVSQLCDIAKETGSQDSFEDNVLYI
uniref:Ell-associated factor Eaf n=1 Tax=Angiostrongylus cantonensis TaxID=6313 RepID=A0A0K0DDU3_ANGCA